MKDRSERIWRIRRGFSFAEIMFAVMLLGIGFIMVAAIFPVAIQQQQAAVEAVNGNEVARNGAALLSGTQFMNLALPDTDNATTPDASALVLSFYDSRMHTPAVPPPPVGVISPSSSADLWNSVASSLIVPGAEHLAYVPVYSRESNSNFALLYVFAVQCRNSSAFTSADVAIPSGGFAPNLSAKRVTVTLTDGGTAPDQVTVSGPNYNAAVEGAYLVISDDGPGVTYTAGSVPQPKGQANGRVYRLGSLISDTGTSATYYLMPGSDMASNAENLTNAQGLIIGRGYTDPTAATPVYSGPSMAIGYHVKLVTLQ